MRNPTKISSKNQDNRAFRTDVPQICEPLSIPVTVEAGVAAAVDQGAVGGCASVRVQRLEWIHQHTGDIAAAGEYRERRGAHFRERIRGARHYRIPDAWLHVVPPAVIRTAEANDVRSAGVETGKPYGLHDGFRPRHVEGDLIHAGDGRSEEHTS